MQRTIHKHSTPVVHNDEGYFLIVTTEEIHWETQLKYYTKYSERIQFYQKLLLHGWWFMFSTNNNGEVYFFYHPEYGYKFSLENFIHISYTFLTVRSVVRCWCKLKTEHLLNPQHVQLNGGYDGMLTIDGIHLPFFYDLINHNNRNEVKDTVKCYMGFLTDTSLNYANFYYAINKFKWDVVNNNLNYFPHGDETHI